MEKNLHGVLEAIMFAMGEPVELSKLVLASGKSEKEVKEALSEMMQEYEDSSRGIKLIALEQSYQLVTKEAYYDELIEIASHPAKPVLTDVLMETLSIVAYRQPVTRTEIDNIRGVSSDHAVNRLVEYDLIREVGRLDAPGKPMLFGTTEEFLRRFGFNSVEALPHMDPVREADFKEEAEAEIEVRV